jgi:hypothetical protein
MQYSEKVFQHLIKQHICVVLLLLLYILRIGPLVCSVSELISETMNPSRHFCRTPRTGDRVPLQNPFLCTTKDSGHT